MFYGIAQWVVFGIPIGMFHGAPMECTKWRCMVHDQTLMFFPNAKNDLPQQILKDVMGQFTF